MRRYTARATWENGASMERNFRWYASVVIWLAQYPEAGIVAYDNLTGGAVNQRQLAEDVCAEMARNA